MNRFTSDQRKELIWKSYYKHTTLDPTEDMKKILNQLSELDFNDVLVQYEEDCIGGFYNYIDVNLFFEHGIRLYVSIEFVPEDSIISYYLNTDNVVKLFDNINDVKDELENIIGIQ